MEILLVEDDVFSAQGIMGLIERWKHHVELAATGKEALEKVRYKVFDLVLLDIFLPDVMGYELIPEFKRFRYDMKIIAMTGHNTPEMERKIRGCGIGYYMAKPVPAEELKSILDHISKKMRKEVKAK